MLREMVEMHSSKHSRHKRDIMEPGQLKCNKCSYCYAGSCNFSFSFHFTPVILLLTGNLQSDAKRLFLSFRNISTVQGDLYILIIISCFSFLISARLIPLPAAGFWRLAELFSDLGIAFALVAQVFKDPETVLVPKDRSPIVAAVDAAVDF